MADIKRPDPPVGPLPPGCEYVAVPEGDRWRLETGRVCRMIEGSPRRRCGQSAVAALNRGYHSAFRDRVDLWWQYCADHLYGRWIEDGRLMIWVARRVEDGGEDLG